MALTTLAETILGVALSASCFEAHKELCEKLARIVDPEFRGEIVSVEGQVLWRGQPTSLEINGQRAILVAGFNRSPSAHGDEGQVRVYYFAKASSHWKLQWKYELASGSFGGSGRFGLSKSREGVPLLLDSSGGTWQGCNHSVASIYALTDGGPVEIAQMLEGYSKIDEGIQKIATARLNSGISMTGFSVKYTIRAGAKSDSFDVVFGSKGASKDARNRGDVLVPVAGNVPKHGC